MDIFTILLFFVYLWGLGFSVTFFFKNSDNYFERQIMRLGIGLGAFVLIGVIIDLLRVPLDWRVFLIVSMIVPGYSAFARKGVAVPKISLTRYNLYIIGVFLIFACVFSMYLAGAFAYPWLEDDDPYLHAEGVKFVSIEKRVHDLPKGFMYINPYPPGYDILMGVLHQTSKSMMWTLKFFNSLIISLGILFFFFFCNRFFESRGKALFSTFIFAAIPCYLSHFIWSHSLVVTLLLVALYCMEMGRRDSRWYIPLAAVIGGICLTQPTQPIKFLVLFFIYAAVRFIADKKVDWKLVLSIIVGYSMSIFWFYDKLSRMYTAGTAKKVGEVAAGGSGGFDLFSVFRVIQKALPPNSGSATRPYSFREIIFAHHQNMINNPIGIGIVIFLLMIVGLAVSAIYYRQLFSKRSGTLIILLWAVFTFLGFNSMTFNLPVGFFSFRFWMLFAIAGSMLAAEGGWFLLSMFKSNRILWFGLLSVIIIGISFTSAHQKYSLNTAQWGPGQGFTSIEEVQGFVWLKENLPVNTRVYSYSDGLFFLGFDMLTCTWCEEYRSFHPKAPNATLGELRSWMKSNGYEYFVIGGRDARYLGEELVNERVMMMGADPAFEAVFQNQGALIFMVN